MTKRYLRNLLAEYSTLEQRSDCLACLSQEIRDALIASEREEMRFHRRLYRNRAYFSLDCDDGIGRTALTHIADPYDVFEALVYKATRAHQKFIGNAGSGEDVTNGMSLSDGSQITFDMFFEQWLPRTARKRNYKPHTLASYRGNWKRHASPFLGSRLLCDGNAKLLDDLVEHLKQKKCDPNSHKSTTPDKTLGSAAVRKVYNIVSSMLKSAAVWGVVGKTELGDAPSVRSKKRNAWSAQQVAAALRDMGGVENTLLHLAVHIAFVCSLRPGELAGFDARSMDPTERSCSIHQALQRANDEDLALIPESEILFKFPKQRLESTSTLILKLPKTEDSDRIVFLPVQLVREIEARLRQIERDKEQYGDDYNDYGLLFSWPNGDPIEPHRIERWFKEWQLDHDMDPRIDMQGLRKSGQMHKIRLSGFNYQLVASNAGHSPEVLMNNYDEALETEKRNLARLIEDSFYESYAEKEMATDFDVERLMEQAKTDPALMQQLLSLVRHVQHPTPSQVIGAVFDA